MLRKRPGKSPERNLVVIMKDGRIYKNALR